MEQLIGQSIGDRIQSDFPDRYQIQDLLGKQTGRRTFLAQDAQTGALVVIKLMLFGPDFTWEDLKLFEREAETLKSLDHPAIPRYLDSFDVETSLGQGFALVQTYIRAKSLQEWVSSGHTFSERDLRGIASGLLRILEYLHCRQPPVIHRDIKPSNILLPDQDSQTQEGIYLVDFGSVQTAQTNGTITIVGTYGYMPPEQFGGQALPASDLYSLGATLIYLATGKHPSELLQADMQIEFDKTHLNQNLTHWLKQLTYADLARRTPSAAQALEQLTHPERFESKDLLKTSSKAIKSHQNAILKSNFADLTIDSTSKDLVMQLTETRIFRQKRFSGFTIPNNNLSPVSALLLAILIFSPVLLQELIGKSIPPKSEPFFVLGIIIAGIITIPLSEFLARRYSKRLKPCQLRLFSDSENSIFLNLFRIERSNDTGWITTDFQSCGSGLLSNSLLLNISTTSGMFKDRVVFTFLQEEGKHKKLEIKGTRKEIVWICEHINQWGKCEIKNRFR